MIVVVEKVITQTAPAPAVLGPVDRSAGLFAARHQVYIGALDVAAGKQVRNFTEQLVHLLDAGGFQAQLIQNLLQPGGVAENERQAGSLLLLLGKHGKRKRT